jgi:hypothetical protein
MRPPPRRPHLLVPATVSDKGSAASTGRHLDILTAGEGAAEHRRLRVTVCIQAHGVVFSSAVRCPVRRWRQIGITPLLSVVFGTVLLLLLLLLLMVVSVVPTQCDAYEWRACPDVIGEKLPRANGDAG